MFNRSNGNVRAMTHPLLLPFSYLSAGVSSTTWLCKPHTQRALSFHSCLFTFGGRRVAAHISTHTFIQTRYIWHQPLGDTVASSFPKRKLTNSWKHSLKNKQLHSAEYWLMMEYWTLQNRPGSFLSTQILLRQWLEARVSAIYWPKVSQSTHWHPFLYKCPCIDWTQEGI